MFNFQKVCVNLDENFVTSKVSESTIFSQYFGRFELGKVYHSPFRRDRRPSAGFYINRRGRLTFHDMATGDRYDAFTFVAKMYGLRYHEAVEKVAHDFGLTKGAVAKFNKEQVFEIDSEIKKQTIIQIQPAQWHKVYLDYWKQYDIMEQDIDKTRIFPVRRLWLNKKLIPTQEIRFAYFVKHEGQVYIKVYSPHSTNMKWLSNVPINVPFGIDTLPYNSNVLFITKSMKDKVVMNKLFTDVIATQNESEISLTDKMQTYLKSKYDRLVIVWDNDPVGVENCKKFNSKGFEYFNIPREYYEMFGVKDPSDFVSYYGINELSKLFKEKGYG